METILIIEDEPELVRGIRSYLEKAGFKVLSEYRGDSGYKTWENMRPDLVILDLNLPGMDGLDIARNIRRQGNTPIIMLTARVEETDRLIGLELGADDYITKPFSVREVVLRVKAVLRRAGKNEPETKKIHILDLEIDQDEMRALREGKELELTLTEFKLLSVLAEKPGRVYNRLQLLETTQGEAFEGYERTIDAHIKNLRAKLQKEKGDPPYIETVFGVGYRFRKED
ncbi:MAG: response regulator transcription factor [Anaerolineaceae bacterium]|nr:response regulator transcription factor [Anaerolineaceae bacterium]